MRIIKKYFFFTALFVCIGSIFTLSVFPFVSDSFSVSDEEKEVISEYIDITSDTPIIKIYANIPISSLGQKSFQDAVSHSKGIIYANGDECCFIDEENKNIDFNDYYGAKKLRHIALSGKDVLLSAEHLKITSDIKITETYCALGVYSYHDLIVYFVTDQGDFVYCTSTSESNNEFVLPADTFNEHCASLNFNKDENGYELYGAGIVDDELFKDYAIGEYTEQTFLTSPQTQETDTDTEALASTNNNYIHLIWIIPLSVLIVILIVLVILKVKKQR
ncbi:MAG: hypothetical protein IJZ83_06275 [Clostridia bacterium]|nr:hypothetical protein [Clostridia bacterium]